MRGFLGWLALAAWLLSPGAAGAQEPALPATEAPALLAEAWALKAGGDLEAARRCFLRALELGADRQVVALELGYLAAAAGDPELARLSFEEAAAGPDEARRAQAEAELRALAPPPAVPDPADPYTWLDEGWRLKAAGDPEGAAGAFQRAGELGADPQLVALELAYLALAQDDEARARARLREAADGPNGVARNRAKAELRALPHPIWGDLYAEGSGWLRLLPEREADFVPLVRLRALWRPWPELDLHAYLALQVSRDLASRSWGPQGFPVIYADNALIVAPGLLWRTWEGRTGLWAQVGPAVMLVDDGAERLRLDARVGAFLDLATPACRPAPLGAGARGRGPAGVCWETYDELIYASRLEHDLIGALRGRVGWTPLLTGRVAWQPLAELRVFADKNGDYWNNQADLGLLHRWRLLGSVPLDLALGLHAGRYLGRENLDPVPDPAGFLELRLLTATYLAF